MNRITNLIMQLNPALAGRVLIGICSVLVVFHAANYFGKVPINVTWLGSLDSNKTIMIMSLVSIILNMVIIFCAAVKCKFIKYRFSDALVEKVLPLVFWWLVGNSVANLFSKSTFEVVVFTPILVVLTVCAYVLKNTDKSENKAI